MNYEGQICRAPMERAAFMLPVMVGCAYGQCKFCNLFRHLRFRMLPLSQIEAELDRVKAVGGQPRKIFLGDGNAFGLPTERLLQILDMIAKRFPACESVNMDATITDVRLKRDDELRALYGHGVRHLYIGIETGLDDVLAFMQKDHTLPQAYEALDRLQRTGLIYDAHIMTGVAGKGRGLENAQALACFLNRTRPRHVVNFSMFLHREVPLYRDIETGAFVPADELENLFEERKLLELLQPAENELVYEGFHDFISFHIRGKLPQDKEKMLEKLDQAIALRRGEKPVYPYVYGQCPDLKKCGGLEKVWEA